MVNNDLGAPRLGKLLLDFFQLAANLLFQSLVSVQDIEQVFDLFEYFAVLGNDLDPDGDALTVTTASAANGTVVIRPDGTIDYDPNGQYDQLDLGESATDTFNYTISDGNGGTATATVTVEDTIVPIAIAQDIEVQLDADGIATITAEDIDNGSSECAYSYL